MESVTTVHAPEVRVSADGLSAFVSVEASAHPFPGADLAAALDRAGVKSGILSDVLARLSGGEPPSGAVLVASGKPPSRGTDGRVEWFFAPEPGQPALYRNAAVGVRLARIHPPAAGASGISVLGAPIPGAAGKPVLLHAGTGTSLDASDPAVILAAADGNIVVKDGVIEVQPILTLRGQVDYTTGNIEFSGSLVIQGDVGGDVAIRVKGSLTVHGNVEDAVIQAGGDVTVDKGFVGRGKGRITSGGSVTVLHILNQTITAANDVVIGRECVNGTITAGGRIQAPGAIIAGGVLHADGDIVANTIGSTDGLQAKLRAGRRGRILDRLTAIERELKAADVQVAEVKEAVYRLVRIQLDSGKLDAEKQGTLTKLQLVQKQLPGRIAGLQAEQQSLKEGLKKNQEVTVTVRETVFENTMVDINGCRKVIDAALQGVVFHERSGAIEASSV